MDVHLSVRIGLTHLLSVFLVVLCQHTGQLKDNGIGNAAVKVVADCIHSSRVKDIGITLLRKHSYVVEDADHYGSMVFDFPRLQEEAVARLQVKLARGIVVFIEILHLLITRNRDLLLAVVEARKQSDLANLSRGHTGGNGSLGSPGGTTIGGGVDRDRDRDRRAFRREQTFSSGPPSVASRGTTWTASEPTPPLPSMLPIRTVHSSNTNSTSGGDDAGSATNTNSAITASTIATNNNNNNNKSNGNNTKSTNTNTNNNITNSATNTGNNSSFGSGTNTIEGDTGRHRPTVSSTFVSPGHAIVSDRTDSAIAVQRELQSSFISMSKALYPMISGILGSETPKWLRLCTQDSYFSSNVYRQTKTRKCGPTEMALTGFVRMSSVLIHCVVAGKKTRMREGGGIVSFPSRLIFDFCTHMCVCFLHRRHVVMSSCRLWICSFCLVASILSLPSLLLGPLRTLDSHG